MRKTICSLLLCASLFASAQSKVELLLWDGNPADTSAIKTVAIRANDYTRDPAITMYLPQKPNGKAVIMCPGGAYGWLAMGHEGHDMAQWFNNQGIAYAVLKYRLPQGHHEIPLTDAEQAIRIVRDNAEKWNIDPANAPHPNRRRNQYRNGRRPARLLPPTTAALPHVPTSKSCFIPSSRWIRPTHTAGRERIC